MRGISKYHQAAEGPEEPDYFPAAVASTIAEGLSFLAVLS